MRESLPQNRIEESSVKSPKTEGEVDPSKVEEFFDKESEILGAYGLKGDVTLERGSNGWAFDFQNRKLIYDPSFFAERGYNLQETLFATTHELMAHCGELLRDPELVLREAKRYSRKEHLHLLHNIFEDVLGNRRIVAELPFLGETRTKLYEEKLFPQTDYQQNASHVQFAYGFIREMMVPGKPVELGPEARQALDKLRSFGEDKIDILDLVTTPSIEPKDRFQIMRSIVEPIYLDLYQKDLEKEKKKGGKKDSGQGGESSPSDQPLQEGKGGESGEEEAKKKFQKEYQPYKDSHPEPLKPEDEEEFKKTLESLASKRGGTPSLDRAIIEQWAKEHGVSAEDVLGYRKEYEEIAPLVAELREVFKQIVSKRLKERWKMSPQLQTEGEVLDEEILAESYVESTAGGKPHAFREISRTNKEQVGYGSLDMTLVNDLSGSMNEGAKLPMDRKSKILFLESLSDFQKEIKDAEYESGISLGLEVRTETRAFGDFGDTELKALSPDLSEKDRITIWKRLHKGSGGTPDYLSLETIEKSLTSEYEEELRSKRKRKVIVVLSDGGSQDANRVQQTCERLRKKGIIILGFGMTASGQAVKETYKPDAEVIEDIRTLPKAMQKVIIKYIQDL
ncbi:hypothetical protein A2814_00740 [Candidatus Nomurabacteria bacterium RIFCSPHIGHO2_01_FULL_38_19]|uniref:VWFA domain-containing protein n=1 Tax=Candidatus Nomurabacteria bacterium RIFCSPHIGHO2_01_FULL_38_19 TaxID=1801732 RepID=A0A1F6UVA5_9BACT|nr:MAG: hypothetical protein A2814_00740 [Candidatus Nomurabacteria bacterium RIFCSPHIGHO2_01_FULL_38_19]